MKCVRCGSEMKDEDRCCLKCGALNYNHPLNKEYAVKYAAKEEVIKANPDLLKKKSNRMKIILPIFICIVIGIVIFFIMKSIS